MESQQTGYSKAQTPGRDTQHIQRKLEQIHCRVLKLVDHFSKIISKIFVTIVATYPKQGQPPPVCWLHKCSRILRTFVLKRCLQLFLFSVF